MTALFGAAHRLYSSLERRAPHIVTFAFATFMRAVRLIARRPTLTVRRYGSLFTLNLNDVALTPKLLLGRVHEPLEVLLMESYVRPGDVVIDIGANAGWFTVLLAKLVGPAGRVIALEPDPVNFGLLAENVRLNGLEKRVELVPAGAGAAAGEGVLYRSERGNYGDQRMYDTRARGRLTPSGTEKIPVPLVAIDALVALGERLRFIKMDVQGFEPYAVAGMTAVLNEHPDALLLTEFWPAGLAAAGTQPAAYLEQLRNLGYTLFELSDDSTSVEAIEAADFPAKYPAHSATYTNLLCVARQNLVRLGGKQSFSVTEFGRALRQ